MKHAFPTVLTSATILTAALATGATAQDGQVQLTPGEIVWSPGPGSIPPGAEAAVLYGNPGEEGLFALRLKMPDGYHIAPHFHPRTEVVTVISGTFLLGHGESADPDAADALEPGSFFAFSPGMAHFGYTKGETVVQLNTMGPWGLEYVNPKDDPRN